MARTRYLKPGFQEDEKMAQLSVFARYLYMQLWTHMDRDGVVEASIGLMKSRIFPHDPEEIRDDIKKSVAELVFHKRLFEIEQDGKNYLFCPTLKKHQRIFANEPSKFKIPLSILTDAMNLNRSQLELPVEELEQVRTSTNKLEHVPPNLNLNSNLNLNLNSNLNLAPPPAPRVDFQSRGTTEVKTPKTIINQKFKIGVPEDLNKPHPPFNPKAIEQLNEFRKMKLVTDDPGGAA